MIALMIRVGQHELSDADAQTLTRIQRRLAAGLPITDTFVYDEKGREVTSRR